jgi:hypothetical protein
VSSLGKVMITTILAQVHFEFVDEYHKTNKPRNFIHFEQPHIAVRVKQVFK